MEATEITEATKTTRSNFISIHLIRRAEQEGRPLADLLDEVPPYKTEAWHDLYAAAQRGNRAAMFAR